MLLSSCQTEPETYPNTTTVIERVVTKDSMCSASGPIKPSHLDVLTSDTKEAIGDHNNAYWCACPSQRPEGFDVAICAMPR